MTTRYEKQAKEWNDVKDELLGAAGPEAGSISAHQVSTEWRKRMLARGERPMTMEEIEEEYRGALPSFPRALLDEAIRVEIQPYAGPLKTSAQKTIKSVQDIVHKVQEDRVAEKISEWLEARREIVRHNPEATASGVLQEAAEEIRSGAWRRDP